MVEQMERAKWVSTAPSRTEHRRTGVSHTHTRERRNFDKYRLSTHPCFENKESDPFLVAEMIRLFPSGQEVQEHQVNSPDGGWIKGLPAW